MNASIRISYKLMNEASNRKGNMAFNISTCLYLVVFKLFKKIQNCIQLIEWEILCKPKKESCKTCKNEFVNSMFQVHKIRSLPFIQTHNIVNVEMHNISIQSIHFFRKDVFHT